MTAASTLQPCSLAALAVLAGCAALEQPDQRGLELRRSGRPAASPAATPSSACPRSRPAPEQQQMLEDAARRALETRRLHARGRRAEPDVLVQVGARVDAHRRAALWDDPLWWRGGFGYGAGAAASGGSGLGPGLMSGLRRAPTLRPRGGPADPRPRERHSRCSRRAPATTAARRRSTVAAAGDVRGRADGLPERRPQPAPRDDRDHAEAAVTRAAARGASLVDSAGGRDRAQVVFPALQLRRRVRRCAGVVALCSAAAKAQL